MYMVFNIGCIECGVSSKIVGLFSDLTKAQEVVAHCEDKHHWREGGQNGYEVFELPEPEVVDAEYLAEPRKPPTAEERVALLRELNEDLVKMVTKEKVNG